MPEGVVGALAKLELALCEWEPMPEDVATRFAALRASLAKWPRVDGDALTILAPVHGRWIRAGGVLIDLKRRRPLRRLVHALVEARIRQPGVPLHSSVLIAAGWPEERVPTEAALNRLYVALTRLRQLGFMDILLSAGDGWLINGAVRVERGAPDATPDAGDDDAADATTSDANNNNTSSAPSYIRELAPTGTGNV